MDDKQINELTLLLLYLTGWEEDSSKNPGEKIYRAWKGYLFQTINALADDKLIVNFANTKSVFFTEAGKQMAAKLKEKYFGEGK